MRKYEVMVILDPELDEKTIAPSLDAFLNVIKADGGSVEKVDLWGSVASPMKSTTKVRVTTQSLN